MAASIYHESLTIDIIWGETTHSNEPYVFYNWITCQQTDLNHLLYVGVIETKHI